MKLGLIGTSGIVKQLVDNVVVDNNFILECVYSRKDETGKTFAQENNINHYTTNLDEMIQMVDCVYVASPNAVHFEQARKVIINKKHILIEKPMTTTYNQTKELYDLAQEHNVFIMEAMAPLANPLMIRLKQELHDQTITNISMTLMQQSRHYQALINGEYVTVFDKKMGGGAVYDLGVYPVYCLLYLVGVPNSYQVIRHTMDERADLTATIICEYDDFSATINISKISFSDNLNTISCLDKTFNFDSTTTLKKLVCRDPKGGCVWQEEITHDDRLVYELRHFYDLIKQRALSSEIYTKQLALEVIKILSS